MHPRHLSIRDFSYELADEKIAKYPLAERDSSKLLIYRDGRIVDAIYKDIDRFLPNHSLTVFNNTKVVEARLIFQKSTGALIEVFCLEPGEQYPDITSGMLATGETYWKCLIGGASKWKYGTSLEKHVDYEGGEIKLRAKLLEKHAGFFLLKFDWHPLHITFAELLHYAGAIPLPPYLHRPAEIEDTIRYQTIYASSNGSVAAPTAGLHFTKDVFDKLVAKEIDKDFVTLHVGAGTFKPVKSETMAEHEMHAEFINVSADTIQNLVAHKDKTIVAVGTTSLRTIESLYWIGVKLFKDPGLLPHQLIIEQWDPYEDTDVAIETEEALLGVLVWMEKNGVTRIITKTRILIAPGYKLRICKGLITNFHQPNSTLLLLVAAIVGKDWQKIYEHALKNNYRFLSYGDGCLLWQNNLPG